MKSALKQGLSLTLQANFTEEVLWQCLCQSPGLHLLVRDGQHPFEASCQTQEKEETTKNVDDEKRHASNLYDVHILILACIHVVSGN